MLPLASVNCTSLCLCLRAAEDAQLFEDLFRWFSVWVGVAASRACAALALLSFEGDEQREKNVDRHRLIHGRPRPVEPAGTLERGGEAFSGWHGRPFGR